MRLEPQASFWEESLDIKGSRNARYEQMWVSRWQEARDSFLFMSSLFFFWRGGGKGMNKFSKGNLAPSAFQILDKRRQEPMSFSKGRHSM